MKYKIVEAQRLEIATRVVVVDDDAELKAWTEEIEKHPELLDRLFAFPADRAIELKIGKSLTEHEIMALAGNGTPPVNIRGTKTISGWLSRNGNGKGAAHDLPLQVPLPLPVATAHPVVPAGTETIDDEDRKYAEVLFSRFINGGNVDSKIGQAMVDTDHAGLVLTAKAFQRTPALSVVGCERPSGRARHITVSFLPPGAIAPVKSRWMLISAKTPRGKSRRYSGARYRAQRSLRFFISLDSVDKHDINWLAVADVSADMVYLVPRNALSTSAQSRRHEICYGSDNRQSFEFDRQVVKMMHNPLGK